MIRKIILAMLLAGPAFAGIDMQQGQLPNGVSYYIKDNQEPADKVELRLVVKAGSRNELEDEKGIAHLVEHMAFRRTTHFGEGQIIAFLNDQGARWGNDSNAWTNWEETVYHFSVSKAQLPQAVQLLADWSGHIVFNPDELKRERQIVLDELRMRNDDSKVWADYADAFYPDREYSQRMPGGEPEVVASLAQARIEGFYHRNYIGPNISVIISGDIKGIDTKKLIADEFSYIPSKSDATPPPKPKLSDGLQLFTNYKAYGLNKSLVTWGWLESWDNVPSEEAKRRDYLRFLALDILQHRLQDKAGDIFSEAGSGRDDNMPHVQSWYLAATPKLGQTRATLQAILFEAEQARRTGFSEAEVKEAKARQMAGYENATRQPQTNALLAQNVLMHVLRGYLVESPQDWLNRARDWDKTVTPTEVQAALNTLLQTSGQIVQIMRAQSDDAGKFGLYDESDLVAIQAAVANSKFANGARAVKTLKLMNELPAPGKIVSTQQVPGGGLWKLDNGMEVLWQNAKEGEKQIGISLKGNANGLLALPEKDRLAAAMWAAYIQNAGLNGLKTEDLADLLQGHTLSISPFVQADRAGASGFAAPEDLELAMQILYLGLQPPQASERAQNNSALAMLHWLDNGQRNNLAQLLAYGKAWPWRNDWTKENVAAIGIADYQRVARAMFGDPQTLRVVLTGIRNPDEVAPLVARYLGAIKPAKDRPALQALVQLPLAERHTTGSRAKDEAWLTWMIASPQAIRTQDVWLSNALGDVLQMRLQPALRFDGGKSYAVFASSDISKPTGVTLHAGNNGPATQCPIMVQKTLEVMKLLASEGPTDAEVTKAIERFVKNDHDNLQNPAMRANSLGNRWYWSGNFAELTPDYAQIVTRQTLADAARRWLKPDNTYLVTDGCSAAISDADLKQLANGDPSTPPQ